MKKALLKLTIVLALTLLVGAGNIASAATYVAPSQTPPNCADGTPGCDSPIHTGLLGQIKQGLLSLAKGLDVYGLLPRVGITGEDLTVRVNGNVGADLYCDVAGGNCIDPANPPGGDTFNNIINQISWPLASTTNPIVGNVTGVYFRNTDPGAGYNGGVSIGTSTNYGTKLSVFNATADTDFNDSSWPTGIFSQVNGAGSTAIVGSVAAGAGSTYSYGSRFISPGVGVFSRGKIGIYSTTRPGGSGGTNSNDLGWFASSTISGAVGLQLSAYFDGPVRVTNYKAGSAQPPVNLQVSGKIGAQQYCDEQGNNCAVAPFGNSGNAGDSLWATSTANVNNIYSKNSGNVGVGTNDPAATLHVVGNVKITDGTQGAGKVLQSDATGLASWVATSTLGIGGGDTNFWAGSLTGNVNNANTGNIGIGTVNPAAKLDVNGNMWANAVGTGLLSAGNVVVRTNAGSGAQGTRPAQLLIGGSTNQNLKAEIGMDTVLKALVIGALEENVAWKNIILANNGGNVGIGTVNPTAKLEVSGQVKITGGAPGLNKVLTSNAAGLATWQSLAGKLTTVPVPAPTDTSEPCSTGSICYVEQTTYRPAGLDPRIIMLKTKTSAGSTGIYEVLCPSGYMMVGISYDGSDDDHAQNIYCSPLIAP